MLVIAALFAFVTVGFNTASYADGPRRHKVFHTISVSTPLVTISKSVATHSARIHVPRHLAHQPQILPASGVLFTSVAPVPSPWPAASGVSATGQPLGGLLRPPQSRTA